jgi:hypothetical protein
MELREKINMSQEQALYKDRIDQKDIEKFKDCIYHTLSLQRHLSLCHSGEGRNPVREIWKMTILIP